MDPRRGVVHFAAPAPRTSAPPTHLTTLASQAPEPAATLGRGTRAAALVWRDIIGKGFAVRAARLLAASTALSWGVVMVVLATRAETLPLDAVALRALALETWLAGACIGLAAARSDGVPGPMADLLRRRGLPAGAASAATGSAWTLHLVRAIGAPGLALLGLAAALAPSLAEGARRSVVAVAALAWVVVASVVLVALARGCAHLGGRHGRGLLVVVVLVPWAAEATLGSGASLPGVLGRGLDLVAGLGSAR